MERTPKIPPLVGFAILAYCLWNSFDMFKAWWITPLEYYTPLLFFLWCLPPLVEWFSGEQPRIGTVNYVLWGMALVLTLIGMLGSLNAIKYIGLTLSIAGFSTWSWMTIIWIISGVSWMPAFGWIGSRLFVTFLTPLRFVIVLLGVAVMIWGIYSRKEKEGQA